MQSFEGKTAVVTGAASGIGRALAERFAMAGMNVVLADIERDALDRAVEEMEARQYHVLGVHTNTMVRDSVQALAACAVHEFGKVHVLCNNAGVALSRELSLAVWELPEADWNWVMGVNFWGVLYGLQTFVPGMLAHGEEGHIVNTASLASWMPAGGVYGVSKHAVLALTETLYRHLKGRNAKLGASVLCPGLVATQILTAERNRPRELGAGTAAADADRIAMARVVFAAAKQPAEIAERVFEAIEADRFYILPNPEWDDGMRARVDTAIARGAPMTMEAAAQMARRAADQ